MAGSTIDTREEGVPDRATSDPASDDVLSGRVREWHEEEGWGVLVTPTLPDHHVWAHYSAVQAEGFRTLTDGQPVTFTVERAEQDGFDWRAVHVWPSGPSQSPTESGGSAHGTGYSSRLDITFDT
ncbi:MULTISPECIES: cold-shock protein [unclassified Streptomyces]|uniref:cold-shock protein n=1 Tax=unclassified Streptomyces TaxID=2593676 RepID=UPI003D714476